MKKLMNPSLSIIIVFLNILLRKLVDKEGKIIKK